MKKIFYFTAIVVCGQIFQPCNAMEQKHPILQFIKSIEEPQSGQWLDPETVIISHKGGSTIHDLTTNTELKKISEISPRHLAVHPNKKLCALTYEKEIEIYDVETDNLMCKYNKENNGFYYIPGFATSIFEPLDDTIVIMHRNLEGTTRFNYKTGGLGMQRYHDDQFMPTIAFHPKEKIMCYARNKGYLSFHKTNTFEQIHDIPVSFIDQSIAREHKFCQFSPDGSLLVEGHRQSFYIRDKNNHRLVKMENIHEIIFHPNGQFLITLSQPNNIISYWELTDMPLKPTLSMSCSSYKDNPAVEHRHMHSYLSCDPDGEKLLVILSKQCLVVPIPFDVIYQPQAREECIFAYFALQHELPKDIRHVLICKLLMLCKR